jgi:hypothetical protein
MVKPSHIFQAQREMRYLFISLNFLATDPVSFLFYTEGYLGKGVLGKYIRPVY